MCFDCLCDESESNNMNSQTTAWDSSMPAQVNGSFVQSQVKINLLKDYSEHYNIEHFDCSRLIQVSEPQHNLLFHLNRRIRQKLFHLQLSQQTIWDIKFKHPKLLQAVQLTWDIPVTWGNHLSTQVLSKDMNYKFDSVQSRD